MATRARLEQALINADAAGDVDAAKALAAAIRNGEYDDAQSAPQAVQQSIASDVPLVAGMQGYEEQQAEQQAQYANSPVNQPRSFIDKAVGIGETGLAALTGATTGVLGQMAGTVKGVGGSILNSTFGTQEGADAAAQEASRMGANFTFAPRTQAGQEYTQALGEAAAPLAAAAPFTQELGIIAQGAKSAAPILESAARNEVSLLRPSISKEKLDIINKLRAGDTDNSLATVELKVSNPSLKDAQGKLLPEAYKIVDDPIAKETIKQGFNDGIVQAVKTSDNYNAKKMLDMLNVSEKGKKNAVYGSENRPTDVIGDSLAQNIQFVKRINREAGADIDKAAKSLEGKQVDVSRSVDTFVTDLADRVKVKLVADKSGGVRPDFRGSDIEGKMYAPEQRLITMIVDRMANTKKPDAYDVHRLKRAIDQTVVYGKTNSKSLWPDVENSVKSLRKNLDSTLDENFESYNAANTKYSDTIQALDDFQKTAGGKVDLFGDGADKQLGILSRRLLSNVQSRQELTNAIKTINETGKKYGNKVQDNIMAQITFANELDNMFGPAAKSSLAGEQSAGTKAALRDIADSRSFYEVAAKGVQKVADKTRGVNQDAAYKSMRELLAKQARKKQQEAAQ